MSIRKVENAKGYVLKVGEGVSGFGAEVKASGRSSGGLLTLIESVTTGGAPLHVHSREDEYFYVVEESISVRCGDEEFEAGTRSFVFLPRGVPHAWDVTSGSATVLMITTPAMLEEFLGEYHGAADEERAQIAAKYGLTFVAE